MHNEYIRHVNSHEKILPPFTDAQNWNLNIKLSQIVPGILTQAFITRIISTYDRKSYLFDQKSTSYSILPHFIRIV